MAEDIDSIAAALNKDHKTTSIVPAPVTQVAVTPVQHTTQEALAHIELVRANVMKYEGQYNMNPHIWLRENGVNKIERRLKEGDTSAITEAFKLSLVAEPKTKSITINTAKPRLG
jgi:ABC-type arginine transport system ATPase subunit